MRKGSCKIVVAIKNVFQCLSHQNSNAISAKPTLHPAKRNVAIDVRRSAEDSSIDITVTLCIADHDGKTAITHPITNIMKDDPANNEIARPNTSNKSEIIYAGRRPYLKQSILF